MKSGTDGPTNKKLAGPGSLTLPEPIDACPEEVARALLASPPRRRKDWRFVQNQDSK